MATARVHDLLTAWRDAERRWEQPGPPEQVRAAALAVVAAYLAYQDAVLPSDTREVLLIVDDEQLYVGAGRAVTTVLGYRPDELFAESERIARRMVPKTVAERELVEEAAAP